jgi:hypothetical protein
MPKILGFCLVFFMVLVSAMNSQRPFAKYQVIEAYEVRPGILMMPRYTADNEVCELGLERLHYSPKLIRLQSGLSRTEIDQTIDELVPLAERGNVIKEINGLITQSGASLTTSMEYENVRIEIYGAVLPFNRQGDMTVDEMIARITWKKRQCR